MEKKTEARKTDKRKLGYKNADLRQKALLAYLEMGKTRSLKAISEKMGIPLITLQTWSAKYNWAQEIERIGAKIREEIDEVINAEAKGVAVQCKSIVKVAVAIMVNKLRQMNKIGNTPEMRWSDLDKMVRLQAELHGILAQNQGVGVVINNNTNPLIPNLTGDVQLLKTMLERMDPYMRIEALKILDELGKAIVVDAEIVDAEQPKPEENKIQCRQQENE